MKEEFYTKALETARSFEGMTEINGNQGFTDKRFETIMRQVGWGIGQAWCAYFAELCWTLPTYSGRSKYLRPMQQLFSGGAVKTFQNFKNDSSGLFTVDQSPTPGAVAIWQTYRKGTPHWTGHAGIVSEVGTNELKCFEGNTNARGGREGIEVALKTRSLNFHAKNGLVLQGFIKIS